MPRTFHTIHKPCLPTCDIWALDCHGRQRHFNTPTTNTTVSLLPRFATSTTSCFF